MNSRHIEMSNENKKHNNKTTDRLKGKKTLKVGHLLDEFEKDDIKKQIDIVDLFGHFNVELKKKGNSYIGICPWHNDVSPSLSVDRNKGLFNCFGCGMSGDVISLVEKMQHVSFKEAVHYLRTIAGGDLKRSVVKARELLATSRPQHDASSDITVTDKNDNKDNKDRRDVGPVIATTEKNNKTNLKAKTYVTLTAITDYYHKTLYDNKKAHAYLQKRGIDSPELLARFNIGFADGSLLEKIGSEQKKEYKKKGIIGEKGAEHFKGCITIPIVDEMGETVEIYGRSINDNSTIKHLYLKGSHKGVFNVKASTVYDEIILTESIIDALSLITLGLENVQATFGTNGFTEEHLTLLKHNRIKQVTLAFDNDEAGNEAAFKIEERLLAEGIRVKAIVPASPASLHVESSLSGAGDFLIKDWNEYLLAGGTKQKIEEHIKQAKIIKPEQSSSATISKDASGYTCTSGDVIYKITGVKDSFVSNLRINIRAECGTGKYYDNVDLYSARSREGYSKNLAAAFFVEQKRVDKDLIVILEYLEAERDNTLSNEETSEDAYIMSAAERTLGMQFLQSKDLFETVAKDMSTLGYVGEEINKKLMYIIAATRKLSNPISVIVTSQSASGKSLLLDTVEKLLPPEEVISVSSFSDKVLNYAKNLSGTFLIIGEAVHKEEIEYQLREIQSKKKLSRLVTRKNPKNGEMESVLVETEARASIAMTTTNHNINPENASRCFIVTVDESNEQTGRIYDEIRKSYTEQGQFEKRKQIPGILAKHHAAGRLLQPCEVIIPYVKYLQFPKGQMRLRRDFGRFLDLIAGIAFIRQFQKERITRSGSICIVADIADYTEAYALMTQGVLKMSVTDIPKGAIDLYDAIRTLATKLSPVLDLKVTEVSITQREVREATSFSQSWIKLYMRVLVEYEYIIQQGNHMRGSRAVYRLREDAPIEVVDFSIIPTPEALHETILKEESNAN